MGQHRPRRRHSRRAGRLHGPRDASRDEHFVPGTKVGLLDLEINRLSKIRCGVTFALSSLSLRSTALRASGGSITSDSHPLFVHHPHQSPASTSTWVRPSTPARSCTTTRSQAPSSAHRRLPEELGRIEYLLSDKTGTLTQNEMELRKLHMGDESYGWDSIDEVASQLATRCSNITATAATSL